MTPMRTSSIPSLNLSTGFLVRLLHRLKYAEAAAPRFSGSSNRVRQLLNLTAEMLEKENAQSGG
jgi:hypothetical protein